ncbi:MAG: alpha/beta hydrolase [Candidatus Eremiobacteraeota bacterium]|uniref:Putative Alpha/beta hydrolase fold-1 n=1 Tax=mine drainage metagenome TaxID=410659 RepID=E6PEL9_9ZZZZ|nr:alpha/beta hydrolase [Candidatus Eremiobacteraeota bacterium]NNM99177.1 alpha/beta hydrolase [Candidatus Eremiobacteraeota bacterium]
MKSLFFALALVGFATTPALAIVPSPAPSPIATFDVGSLHVQKFGGGPKTLIFIPGLTCGPWEWSGEIAHFSSQYTIYALTLPGFDGQAPISGALFKTTTADFWKLLARRHIVKPVVIGHSLGGTMGFMLATQHPHRLGGVIALDGLPILPGFNFMPIAQRQAIAAQTAAQLAKETHAQFAKYERTTVVPALVTSPADANVIATLVSKSDPAESGRWLAEDMTLDLRPQLHKAVVPILLIAPFDAAVDGRFHMKTPAQKRAFYQTLVAGAPNLQIDTIDRSRHFAMYDRPHAVTADITQFLAKILR